MQTGKPFRFHTPSSILVVGPSGCGKTAFTEKLLVDNPELFERPPTQVHYCYGAWQDRFRGMQDRGVRFHEGIPDHDALVQWFPQGQGVLVLDDLMDEGSHDKRVLDLFTKHSHHQGVTVLYLCQDMFPVGRYAKSISRNAHYIVAFKNPPGSIRGTQCHAAIVSDHLERHLGDLSSSHHAPVWLFDVGFTSLLLGSTTVMESPVKRRRMDAHLSKAPIKGQHPFWKPEKRATMADEEDRQPPQSYDTVSPAGVGASSNNVMSPRAWQDLYISGDQGLLDAAMEEMPPDPLYEFMQSLPPADVIASWPNVTDVPPAQASSPAGVGSPGKSVVP